MKLKNNIYYVLYYNYSKKSMSRTTVTRRLTGEDWAKVNSDTDGAFRCGRHGCKRRVLLGVDVKGVVMPLTPTCLEHAPTCITAKCNKHSHYDIKAKKVYGFCKNCKKTPAHFCVVCGDDAWHLRQTCINAAITADPNHHSLLKLGKHGSYRTVGQAANDDALPDTNAIRSDAQVARRPDAKATDTTGAKTKPAATHASIVRDAEARAKAVANAKTDAEANAEAGAEDKSDAKAEAGAESNADAKAEAGAEAEAEAGADAKAEANAEAGAGAVADTKTASDTPGPHNRYTPGRVPVVDLAQLMRRVSNEDLPRLFQGLMEAGMLPVVYH